MTAVRAIVHVHDKKRGGAAAIAAEARDNVRAYASYREKHLLYSQDVAVLEVTAGTSVEIALGQCEGLVFVSDETTTTFGLEQLCGRSPQVVVWTGRPQHPVAEFASAAGLAVSLAGEAPWAPMRTSGATPLYACVDLDVLDGRFTGGADREGLTTRALYRALRGALSSGWVGLEIRGYDPALDRHGVGLAAATGLLQVVAEADEE